MRVLLWHDAMHLAPSLKAEDPFYSSYGQVWNELIRVVKRPHH
jgi:hypothetical protein